MSLICHKVSVCWDLLCCDDQPDFSTFDPPSSNLRVINSTTSTIQSVQDPDTCAELIPQFTVEWDPTTGCLCTCELPSNIGTDPATYLNPGGTVYQWSVNFQGQSRSYTFQLDADTDYSTVAVDGCIPVCELTLDVPAALDVNLLDERVCDLPCILDLQAQIDAIPPDTTITNESLTFEIGPNGIRVTVTDTEGDEVADVISTAEFGDLVETFIPEQPEICDQINTIMTGNANTPIGTLVAVTPGGECRLVPVPEDEGNALDCGGDLIDGTFTPLTVEQGHAPAIVSGAGLACIDPACAPAPPACPIEGMVTFTDNGITWQWISGGWRAVQVAPTSDVAVLSGGGTVTLGDADISALVGAGQTAVACIESTFTNTDCVPISGNIFVRAQVNMAAGEGNVWTALLGIGPNDTLGASSLIMGLPNNVLDSSAEAPNVGGTNYADNETLFTQSFVDGLAPGDSFTYSICVNLLITDYTPDPLNLIRVAGLTARFQHSRDVTCAI